MRTYTIGLDLGTSSAKGVLLDAAGTIVAEDTCRMHYREDAGYIGFDAAAFADDVIALIARLGAKRPDDGRVIGIAAVCASGNTVICDGNGKPLCDAFSWTCPEMNDEVAQILRPVFGDEYLSREVTRARSGWPFHDAFPLAHLCYLKVHFPAALAAAKTVAMSGEYLLWRLCGKWGIDRSTATPFFLLEQETGRWHKPYLDALGIDASMLPAVGRTGDKLGNLTAEAATATGLDPDCAVYLGSFDHPGGARASDIRNEGDLLISCGTSWVCLFPVKDRDLVLRQKLLCDPFLSPEGAWAGIFSVPQVGTLLDRAIAKYAGEDADRFDRFYAMADAATATADIDLDAPLPDADGNEPALCRGVLCAITARLRAAMGNIEAEGIAFRRAVMVGGPSRSPVCRKIVAEQLGIPVEYHFGASSGAVGAALLARG